MIQIDMDMPKRCISCPLCKHIHLADSPLLIYACGKGMRPIYSHETAEGVDEFSKMEKPEWCPLKEVRHGKWIPVRSYEAFGGDKIMWEIRGNPVAFYYCSECRNDAYAGEDGESLLTKYCPECGADMRVEG